MTFFRLAIAGVEAVAILGSALIALGFFNGACIARTGFHPPDELTRQLVTLGACLGILYGILKLLCCYNFPAPGG